MLYPHFLELQRHPFLYAVCVSNIGVIQLDMFEPDTESQENEEEVIGQDYLHVDASAAPAIFKRP